MVETSNAPWQAKLAALCESRAAKTQHLRWHHLSVLARRTEFAPSDVQAVLVPKVNALLDLWLSELEPRVAESATHATHANQPQVYGEQPNAVAAKPGPLAALTQYLHAATQAKSQGHAIEGGERLHDSGLPGDSPNVLRFHETWAHIAAANRLARAASRAPDNAGPYNSHMLVLRSLALMQEASPEYLRRFLAHLETLLWLERASPPVVPKAASKSKIVRSGNVKK